MSSSILTTDISQDHPPTDDGVYILLIPLTSKYATPRWYSAMAWWEVMYDLKPSDAIANRYSPVEEDLVLQMAVRAVGFNVD